jgi:hypothetical protein
MSLQILEIVLYGPVEKPRVVRLKPGQLNVITGRSKTGKSALIAIVDYCLGAGHCGVAYGPIRDTVEWYGLRLQIGGAQYFVARQAPEPSKGTSSAAYIEVGVKVESPLKSAITPTTTIQAVVALLSRASGIRDNKTEPGATHTRVAYAADIRHALYFCFQPQDEIISRKRLFFQQGEPFVAQSIRDVLPYFLGAVDDDRVVKNARLRQLKHDLRVAQKRQSEAEAIAGEGGRRALALLSEARSVGLVPESVAQVAEREAIGVLREVLLTPVPPTPPLVNDQVREEYERQLESQSALTQVLRRNEADLAGARSLASEQSRFRAEAAESTARLRSLDLLPLVKPEKSTCPLCLSDLVDTHDVDTITRALSALSKQLEAVEHERPYLEKHTAELEGVIAQTQNQLVEIRERLTALQVSDRELAEYRDRLGVVGHVRGRISVYLEAVVAAPGHDPAVAEQVMALEQRIAALESELEDSEKEDRLESLLSLVSHQLTEAGRALDLEHSEFALRLDVRHLTVVSDTPTAAISMEHMGSGSNWVGYHIAAHLALHRVFAQANRPVPGFLFLDQPSQVYFPADVDVTGRLEKGVPDRKVDEDRAAVLRMFEYVRDVVASLDGKIQVIITEHADPDVEWFNASVVERWRADEALIPKAWINAANNQ